MATPNKPTPTSASRNTPAEGTPTEGTAAAGTTAPADTTAAKNPTAEAPRLAQLRRRRIVAHIITTLLAIGLIYLLFHDTLPSRSNTKAWDYTLNLVIGQVGAMIVVSVAIGFSTVLFQTVTANRILTPSIIGFDSLFLLIQTIMIWTVGATVGEEGSIFDHALANYSISAGLMVIFAMTLYGWLLVGKRIALPTLLLVGLVFGLVFRSITGMFQRMLDPAAYMQLQSVMFADFSFVNPTLLMISGGVTALCAIFALLRHRRYDVMLLGRDPAISLGINHRRETIIVLFLCTLFVSSATALVGPVLFFGIIIANASYQVLSTQRHIHTLPLSAGLGIIALAGGQYALRQLGVEGSLSIVIEFIGGLFFLFLLLKGRTA